MRIVVDTNVPVTANAHSQQASPDCIRACVRRLDRLCREDTLVLDDSWIILREYMNNLHSVGQPGVGDAFLKWVLTNWRNPRRCELVHLIHQNAGDSRFAEFPDDEELAGFDVSDRKFVAVALTHGEQPPIANAVDRDWWDYRVPLARYGITVEFVCSDLWQS